MANPIQALKINHNFTEVKGEFDRLIEHINSVAKNPINLNLNLTQIKTQMNELATQATKLSQTMNSSMGNFGGNKATEDLVKIKGKVEEIRKQYEAIGKTKIVPETFDSEGKLKSFTLQLEQVEGLMQKIKYESSFVTGSGNSLVPTGNFNATGITQTDNTAKVAEQQRILNEKVNADKMKLEQQASEAQKKYLAEELASVEEINAKKLASDQKRIAEETKLEEAQAKAVNKSLEEEYALKQKMAKQTATLGTKVDDSKTGALNYDASTASIEKYLKANMGLKATMTSIGDATDSYGNKMKKINYTVDEGKGFVHKYQMTMDEATKSSYNLSKGIENVGLKEGNFTARIKNAIVAVASFATVTTALYAAVHQVQEGITLVNDMNKAQTNIGMITGMTSTETKQLTKDYSELAGQLHETTDSIMTASEEFLRAGNTIEDTATLLKSSTVMSKIAGQTQEEASQSLIAIQNAYGMNASQMMGVVDKLVAVDNMSATSTAELSGALNKSASSAQTAGVSFEQLVSWINKPVPLFSNK